MNYIEIYFNNVLQKSYPLNQDAFIIGRSEKANLRLNNKGVSNYHVMIQSQDGKLYIEDMNSTNGTFLNDKKLTEKQPLQIGDAISVSKYVLKVNDQTAEIPDQESDAGMQLEEDDQTILVMANTAGDKIKSTSNIYLMLQGDKHNLHKVSLKKDKYRIGLAKDNDIHLRGWRFFTPKYAAEIHRIGEAFYVQPLKKSYIRVNDQLINNSVRLKNNDFIQIKKMTLEFVHQIKQ